jgi:hypothetical protein
MAYVFKSLILQDKLVFIDKIHVEILLFYSLEIGLLKLFGR